ncbi:UNVERIFIED_CONTAM: hypothetical protein PYX00_006469 [Menopon gallinae]|uniref:Schwannomin interacting protein 1 C-terminal domain-containing protein n=1 Tax=Menopon gallinae TaxID=328185 RepID=A0AAW2HVU9_9NEOP
MFENFISNLKFHSLKVSESLNNLKSHTSNGIVGIKTKFRELSPSENNVEHNPIPQSPETPIGNVISNSIEMKWLESLPKEMQWVAQVPNEDESEDIVERFTYISDSRNLHRRTDREEIRRRLAMGADSDDYYGGERTLRKPSLQTRLQSGMNLQICFMNEAISDNESPNSDSELGNSVSSVDNNAEEKNATKRPDALPVNKCNIGTIPPNHVRPSTSLLTLPLKKENEFKSKAMTATDFFSCQAQLQAEARLALSQAKEMARMQMEVERQKMKTSPITEMVRNSLEKVGIPFPHDRRRLSRQILTEMNIAQLQVIVNDLHTQIEKLNESLVKFLIGRDDLHMEQDSMLVDIEDLTRYLGAKEKPQDVPNMNMVNRNNNINRTQNQNRISVNDLRSKD